MKYVLRKILTQISIGMHVVSMLISFSCQRIIEQSDFFFYILPGLEEFFKVPSM